MQCQILHGDCREVLRDLPAESVHCVVTSPPYWGLRSYGGDEGMIGLEPAFEEHLENLVAVFREVRRVLRDDGTLWLNYGDAYATSGGHSSHGHNAQVTWTAEANVQLGMTQNKSGLKSKNLMMMPARVAMVLQADGWWLRSEIIWHKPNPMPESCTDRPTSSHEKLFLLSKSARYFYDAEAVRVHRTHESMARDQRANLTGPHVPPGAVEHSGITAGGRGRGEIDPTTRANLRNVWTIPTHSFKEAHFATFPPALVEPCIKAGTSERGVCGECGAPWARDVETSGSGGNKGCNASIPPGAKNPVGYARLGGGAYIASRETVGWSPTCEHKAATVPAVCLDPFAGSGTVGQVALSHGRSFIGVEINPEYVEMGKRRTESAAPLFTEIVDDEAD